MKKKVIIGAILFFLALIHPITFYYYEGEHRILNESTYLSRNNNNNETQRVEKFDQYRIIYHAYKNIKLGRYDTFSTIDDNNVINSFPIYKYYSPALFYLLGLLMFLFHDVVLCYTFAVAVFSALYVAGIFLLARKFTKDAATACLVAAVAVTAPYMTTNTLSRYGLSEEIAGFIQPMLLYLALEVLEKGKHLLKREQIIQYVTTATYFTALGTFFVLTHNITTLYTPLIFGIPMLVYIFITIKPTFRSIMLFCIPIALMFLASLFYIVPSMQTQTRLMISDTFAGLLFPYLKINTLGSLFSPMPTMSPISTTPALWLQIGWPTLILAVLFFRDRTIVIWGIFLFMIVMILSPTIWMVLPQPFLAIQFPYRMLAYIPLLFVFASRKLSMRTIVIVGIITAIFAGIFINRPTAPGSFYAYDFDMFPSENIWNYYYKGENPNIQIQGIGPSDETTIKNTSDSKKKLVHVVTLEPQKEKASAVTYRFKIAKTKEAVPFTVVTTTTLKDGKVINRLMRYGAQDMSSFTLSYCLRNVTSQKLSIEPPPSYKGSIEIARFSDTSKMYLASGDQFFPVICDYEEKENGKIFVFHPEKVTEEKTLLLPIFYSELNQVVDKDSNPLSSQPFIDAELRSYTAVKNVPNNQEIRVKLYGNDHWGVISYPVIYLIILMTFLSMAVTIGTIIKRKNHHAKAHL